MPITDPELVKIEERNSKRKELKIAASLGPWSYDSHGFIFQSQAVPAGDRLAVVVRPTQWFDSLPGVVIDEGIPRELRQQIFLDASYIASSRTDEADSDVETLLVEVRRLRAQRDPYPPPQEEIERQVREAVLHGYITKQFTVKIIGQPNITAADVELALVEWCKPSSTGPLFGISVQEMGSETPD
jgi:hypothetical protein